MGLVHHQGEAPQGQAPCGTDTRQCPVGTGVLGSGLLAGITGFVF